MKPLFFFMVADLASPTGPVFSIIIVIAAIIMMLNQLGVMPKGKTAERLKLDLEVSEKELAKEKVESARLQALLKLESDRPDYRELVHLMIDHDKRMMELASAGAKRDELIADKLNAISIAVIPPLNIRD